ncbi:hypothetical protein [Hymenobacter rubripertinctus]|uniref:DUF6311 domain-containing protein n=1 Tax=Hymenobacter rubripertinctus TaxID=2029981 RepID=A0A418R298_9BACT|nr:hypothetical protein [Hymenobacter rubripertinctus]RIY11543.1 hypothetical protein D0T11_06970 [Hymenobacter rubripertinctus]
MRFSLAAVRSWQPSRGLLVALALGLQVLLVLRAFKGLLLEPGQHLLVDINDGAKNYYTFQAYVQQPWANGLRWFSMMNYPYGDYLFYTDNTPLLAVPVRLWSHYLTDLRPYALDVYHWLLVSGFLLSTVLLTAILRRLLRHWGLVVVFAVTLPWLSPQASRLLFGHFNLSYSWVLLLAIWGVLNLHERAGAGRPIGRWVAGLVGGFVLAGLIHLYYLPLLAVVTGGFFAWWLLPRGRWLTRRPLALAGAVLTLVPALTCLLIVRAVDGYYHLRSKGATGFNYEPWKLQVSALFRSPEYNAVRFWVEARDQPSFESGAYLGAFVLFALTLYAAVWAVRPAAGRAFWTGWRGSVWWPFLGLLLGAALISLLISVGTVYNLNNGAYTIHNYLNLFFYAQKISAITTQFRVLARFSWVFFWAANLLVLAGLDFWLLSNRWTGRWLVAVGLVLLVVVDTRDAVKHYRHTVPNSLTNARYTPEISQLLRSVQPGQYQAILPVPYFHVGTEDLELTLDDDDPHSLHAYQLALRTNLPLMASKMSRTPPEHLVELRSIFMPQGPTPALRSRLRAAQKPLLVLYDQRYYETPDLLAAQRAKPKVRKIIDAGADLPARQHMTLLAQAGSLRLYRWDVR